MSWNSYWVQWVVQNVLPPSFWTLAGIALHYAGTRHRSVVHHAEQLAQAARHHREKLAQADRHADEIKRQLTVHCSDIKEHVTATAAPGSGDRM